MSRTEKSAIKHYAKMVQYPCGVMDIMACSDAIFGAKGWEAADEWAKPKRKPSEGHARKCADPEGEDMQRSMRRARAKVRRLALANDFKYFVTLTLDPMMVDRESPEAVVKKLNAWCSNAVQRHGLRYILVPELHKKGGIHFHGFFNGAFPATDSGTIRLPWAKKPRKPRSAAERADWLAQGGRIVYNLPAWTLGFTTAMELYGEYPAAVAYVCKYIGKDGTKPAGRWYYSGGALKEPKTEYAELSPAELRETYGDRAMMVDLPGKKLCLVNGIVLEQVQKGD